MRSLRNVANTPLGIDIDQVLVAGVAHASVGMSNAEAREVFRRVTERATEVPGISAAATSVGLSFGLGWGTSLFVPGREKPSQTNNPSQYAVTPDYFKVLGIRLVDGRLFTEADRVGTPLVTVINETAARTFWPGQNPVGQCVRVGADTMPCTTVIGVVTNARRQDLVEKPTSMVYRPLDQLDPATYERSVSFFGFSFIARTTRKPATLAEPLTAIDPVRGPQHALRAGAAVVGSARPPDAVMDAGRDDVQHLRRAVVAARRDRRSTAWWRSPWRSGSTNSACAWR